MTTEVLCIKIDVDAEQALERIDQIKEQAKELIFISQKNIEPLIADYKTLVKWILVSQVATLLIGILIGRAL